MPKFNIKDTNLGNVSITIKDEEIEKEKTYLIKSLGVLMLFCMEKNNTDSDRKKFQEFVDVIQLAIKESEEIYNGKPPEPAPLQDF